jgi:hypothetical protein
VNNVTELRVTLSLLPAAPLKLYAVLKFHTANTTTGLFEDGWQNMPLEGT